VCVYNSNDISIKIHQTEITVELNLWWYSSSCQITGNARGYSFGCWDLSRVVGISFIRLFVYTDCLCTLIVCVHWLFVYTDCLCTLIVCVHRWFVCTMVCVHWLCVYTIVCVHWLLLYLVCLCKLIVCVNWLLVYLDCLCTLIVCVHWINTFCPLRLNFPNSKIQ
jgi:hypothetical protein